jgi:predicted permease
MGLLSYAKGLPSIFTTSLAVVMVLAWARSYGRVRDLPVFRHVSPISWSMVLAQVGAFAAFAWLTISVFENGVTSPTFAALWILAWAAMGFATGVLWLLAALPAREGLRGRWFKVNLFLAGHSSKEAALSCGPCELLVKRI